MENIYWPRGQAPGGRDRYWAVVANAEGVRSDETYRLEVRRGHRIVRRHEGLVTNLVGSEVGGLVECKGR